jgi:hypothetical protein
MVDPKVQAETQLRNIEQATGLSVSDFAAAVREAALEKHGEIVRFLKSSHGLTHGHANLLAHTIREQLQGGPASDDELLDAQYSRAKKAMRPVYEKIAAIAATQGDDVERANRDSDVQCGILRPAAGEW